MTPADLTAREGENIRTVKKNWIVLLLKKLNVGHQKLQGVQYNLSKGLFKSFSEVYNVSADKEKRV